MSASRSVQGDLKAFSIFDVTQSLLIGRKTALVTVQSGPRRGYIHFKDGQIVAATDHTLAIGERAAMNVFSWSGGSFTIEFDREPDAPNIRVPTDHLLLEVARNLDEIRRDEGIDHEQTTRADSEKVEGNMRDRVQDRLRRELNSIFKRVAAAAEPTRARYTPNAFDPLLQALNDLKGTVLFLRPGQRPRVKTAGGFVTIKAEAITESEIEGFLTCILSEGEAAALRESKETTTAYCSGKHGAFRIHVLSEHGTLLVTFTPAGKTLPRLEDVCPDATVRAALSELREGLVVIAGPLGAGKGEFVGSVIQEHMKLHDAFAVLFSRGNAWGFDGEKGFCVRREVPLDEGSLHPSVRLALEQGPDLLAISGPESRDAFSIALAAAGTRRLVLLTIESNGRADTMTRLTRLCRTPDGDDMIEGLADRLRAIILLAPSARDGIHIDSTLLVADRERESLRLGRIEAFRKSFTAPSVASAPEPVPAAH